MIELNIKNLIFNKTVGQIKFFMTAIEKARTLNYQESAQNMRKGYQKNLDAPYNTV